MRPVSLSPLLAALSLLSVSAVAQTALPTTPTAPSADASLTTYIVTRPDVRKCAYPYCGGVFVKAVNRALTRCADGRWQRECHAVDLDTRALGWSDEQRAAFTASFSAGQALVQGALGTQDIQSVAAPVLTAAQAWQGQTLKKPAGTFYAVKSTGIVCITTPCPSLAATRLNSLGAPTHPDLDLTTSGATDDQVQAAGVALSTSGVLVAGTMVPTPTAGLDGRTRWWSRLVATEFYLPAKP